MYYIYALKDNWGDIKETGVTNNLSSLQTDLKIKIIKFAETEERAHILKNAYDILFGFRNIEKKQVSFKKDKKTSNKPVLAFRKDTGEFVGEYPSQMECARQLGVHQGNIACVIKGVSKSAGGYTFKNAVTTGE
jgi:hypothetical protein